MSTTVRTIRSMLSTAYSETAFFGKTNETYYPAAWTMGDGAGSASTACKYDQRRGMAAEWVASQLGLHMDYMEFADCPRLIDCATTIADALKTQAEADAKEERALDDPIATTA